MPRSWTRLGASTSASTRIAPPQAARPWAREAETVERPGAPCGPHTRTILPWSPSSAGLIAAGKECSGTPVAAGSGPGRRFCPGSPPVPAPLEVGGGGEGTIASSEEPGDCRHSSSSQAVSWAAAFEPIEAGVAALNQSVSAATGAVTVSDTAALAGPVPWDDPLEGAPRRTRSCSAEQMRPGSVSRLRTGHPALRQRSSSWGSTRSRPLRPARARRSRTVRSISSNPVSSRAKLASPAIPAESSSGRSAHRRTTHSPLPAWLSARRMSASSPLRARRSPAPGAFTRPSPPVLPGRWEPGRAPPPARRR